MQNDLIDLQTRIAYQDDTIAALNKIVTEQQRDIQQLQQQMRAMAERIKEVQHEKSQSEGIDFSDERPPHY